MSRIGDYLALLRDRHHIGRTVVRRAAGPALTIDPPRHHEKVREAVERFHPERIPVRIVDVRSETRSTKVLRLVPLKGCFPPFYAGQYVNVFVEVGGVKTSRPYSIASPPTRLGGIELAVRAKKDGFVTGHLLERAKVGDVLTVSGPAGEFYYNPLRDTNELVLMAGGSGIAPILAIIEDVIDRGLPIRMLLLYGSRIASDIIFEEHLARLAASHSQLEVVHVISEPSASWKGDTGLLDGDCVLRHVSRRSLKKKTYFLCGPGKMYQLASASLRELGVPRHRIRVEAYGPPDDITKEPGWPSDVARNATFAVHLQGRGETFEASAAEPLMNSLERLGTVLPALCRSGACGTCRTRLLQGEVFAPQGVAVRESDRTAGFIHPCMSYPVSDLVLQLP